jgi:hypothetical protein
LDGPSEDIDEEAGDTDRTSIADVIACVIRPRLFVFVPRKERGGENEMADEEDLELAIQLSKTLMVCDGLRCVEGMGPFFVCCVR